MEITPEIIELACQAKEFRRLLGWLAESGEGLYKDDIVRLCVQYGIEVNVDDRE